MASTYRRSSCAWPACTVQGKAVFLSLISALWQQLRCCSGPLASLQLSGQALQPQSKSRSCPTQSITGRLGLEAKRSKEACAVLFDPCCSHEMANLFIGLTWPGPPFLDHMRRQEGCAGVQRHLTLIALFSRARSLTSHSCAAPKEKLHSVRSLQPAPSCSGSQSAI